MAKANMRSQCRKCGYETARSMAICVRCGNELTYSAPNAGASIVAVMFLAVLVVVLGVAWNRFRPGPSPLLGKWSNDRATLVLDKAGTAKTNAVFGADGTLNLVPETRTAKWASNANFITFTAPNATSKQFTPPRKVTWEVKDGGKTLKLAGVGAHGHLMDKLTLTRR